MRLLTLVGFFPRANGRYQPGEFARLGCPFRCIADRIGAYGRRIVRPYPQYSSKHFLIAHDDDCRHLGNESVGEEFPRLKMEGPGYRDAA